VPENINPFSFSVVEVNSNGLFITGSEYTCNACDRSWAL
jgi:hypothetical protein